MSDPPTQQLKLDFYPMPEGRGGTMVLRHLHPDSATDPPDPNVTDNVATNNCKTDVKTGKVCRLPGDVLGQELSDMVLARLKTSVEDADLVPTEPAILASLVMVCPEPEWDSTHAHEGEGMGKTTGWWVMDAIRRFFGKEEMLPFDESSQGFIVDHRQGVVLHRFPYDPTTGEDEILLWEMSMNASFADRALPAEDWIFAVKRE